MSTVSVLGNNTSKPLGETQKIIAIGTYGDRILSDNEKSEFAVEVSGEIVNVIGENASKVSPTRAEGTIYGPGGSNKIQYTGEVVALDLGPQLTDASDDDYEANDASQAGISTLGLLVGGGALAGVAYFMSNS